jgi:hypothetical protein
VAEAAGRLGRREVSRDNVWSVARDLADDVPRLVREEVGLAKAEVRMAATSKAMKAATSAAFLFLMAVGVVLLAVAASTAITLATATPWAGPLLTGAGLVVIAAIGLAIERSISRRGAKSPPAE